MAGQAFGNGSKSSFALALFCWDGGGCTAVSCRFPTESCHRQDGGGALKQWVTRILFTVASSATQWYKKKTSNTAGKENTLSGRIRGGKEKTGKGKVDRREESLSEIRRNRRISPAQPNTHLYFFYYLLSKRADFGGTRDCHVFWALILTGDSIKCSCIILNVAV